MQISAHDYEDYRAFLRASLAAKARKNPAFSLRAFARFSGLSPSHLSRALSGKKKLSATSVHTISASLGLSAAETQHLLALVELEKTKDEGKRNQILRSLSLQTRGKVKVLSLETFQAVADWQHFAILALANTKGFRSSSSWIARRLGIKPLEARLAVERLKQLGLLEDRKGIWKAVNGAQISTTADISSTAIRENHRQHLQLAQTALQEVAVARREFNNLTLAMNPADLPKAKQKIRAFVAEFNREMERPQGQELYQLNLQFYPLTEKEKGQA